MSLKAVHRILDIIDIAFDSEKEVDFFNDPTLEHYKIPNRRIYLILENLLVEEMIKGIRLEGTYSDFKIVQETPRLTFKGMNYLYTTVV